MELFIILLLSVGFVAGNVCENQDQEMGLSIAASFGIPGATACYFLNILEDQERSLLYFVGYYRTGSAPWDTVIYKSDPSLNKIKVMKYDIYWQFYSLRINPTGDFLYVPDRATNKIIQIETTSLGITRELSISSSSITGQTSISMNNQNLFFSVKIGSAIEVCRWNYINTDLDWFNLGVNSFFNFATINDDLLFLGSVDSTLDQYYLLNYNFSDPSNFVWKKSIGCPTSSWTTSWSSSVWSRDKQSIYTIILYDNNFLFYTIKTIDGSPQNSGLIWSDSGHQSAYTIREFNNIVAVRLGTNLRRLVLFNKNDINAVEEYRYNNIRSYAIGRLVNNGEEIMYNSGIYLSNFTLFYAKSSIHNVDQLEEFVSETQQFSPITTNYQICHTNSNPSLTSSSKTLIVSTSSSITTNDATLATSPTFAIYVALWNEDHLQTVQSDSLVLVNFTWAWSQSRNYTDIAFSLVQTGANDIPKWVQWDTDNQELYLNKTPRLNETKIYYFSLQISFNSEVHYKKFEITVEKWTIANCQKCQLQNPSSWAVWKEGYEGLSCHKASPSTESNTRTTQAASGTTETATALVLASMIMITISSILSLSSINSLFSVINSLQLSILLPLVPDYFSQKIIDFLNSMGFAMLSFDFIKFKDIPFVKAITKWVAYPQSDQYLNSIGMRSGSSVINYLSLMAIIVLLGVLHFWVLLFMKSKCISKKRKIYKILTKLFKFMTFNIYIRIFIQAFVFTTLSIFSELYAMNFETTIAKVSFGFCTMFWLCTSVLFVLSFIMYWLSFPQFDVEKYWLCKEYFNGVKPTTFSKLYSSLFMMLRLLLVSVLVFGESIDSLYQAIYFSALNVMYGVYLAVVRPFEYTQDNIIEAINQGLFCWLAIPLVWINTETDWTSFYENYYITILMLSPSLGGIISFTFLIKSFITYLKNLRSHKCSKITTKNPPPKQPQTTPPPHPHPSHISNPNSNFLQSQASISKLAKPHNPVFPNPPKRILINTHD